MITNFKIFESNKFKYGDYIIYKIEYWAGLTKTKFNMKYSLIIMSINGTPGTSNTKYDYYIVNELYKLVHGILIYQISWEPKEIFKDTLEKNTIYHTKSLEDAKKMILVIEDSEKYNL